MADSLPTVLHGGKRIRFSNGNGREWRLVSGAPAWQSLTGVVDIPPNATSRSKQGHPHGSAFPGQVDTVVTVSKAYLGSSGTQRTDRFTVRINGAPFRDVDVVVPKRQNSPVEYSGCASWYVSDPSITSCLENATPFIYAWRDSVATTASVGMYPTGDTIVLAVAQDSFAFNIGAPQGHGNTWERPYGDYSNTVSTTLYFIPVQGGSVRTASVSRRVEALGVSEDGLHLVAQVRDRFWSKYTTTTLGFATVRHNICAAKYFHRSGAFSLGSQIQRRSPWASNAPCVPGSVFAP